MPAIGITGHIRLTAGSVKPIYEALAAVLTECSDSPPHGVTCLAGGVDQIFARAVLARRGTLDVILPARDYRDALVPPDNRGAFDDLLRQARTVEVLDCEQSNAAAYLAAGKALVARVELLVAVWDRVAGSATADVVTLARRRGLAVRVVWPPGATRT